MPTYEYECPEGHEFEKFQKMTDRPRAKCPVCGKPATRKISGGAGLVFKGSGFYITDYGKDGKGPRKPAEGGESKSEAAKPEPAKSEPKAESKPAAKAEGGGKESKPAAKKAE
jgi:putative FmdB family regulatory protein